MSLLPLSSDLCLLLCRGLGGGLCKAATTAPKSYCGQLLLCSVSPAGCVPRVSGRWLAVTTPGAIGCTVDRLLSATVSVLCIRGAFGWSFWIGDYCCVISTTLYNILICGLLIFVNLLLSRTSLDMALLSTFSYWFCLTSMLIFYCRKGPVYFG